MVSYVQDPIYGLIEVSPICMKFIDTPEFQRLKRIKQLGMTPEVFPSGVHTRFEHSLGVMHLTGDMFSNLLGNSSKKFKKFKKFKPLIELAGLLHDIGHCAFSHLFEEALKIKGVKFCHELHSIYLIGKINERLNLLSEEELMIIEAMIIGKRIPNYPPFLFEIVANKDSGLDTDKMDYLKRDAFHIGKPQITIDYIIKHCRIDKTKHVSFYYKTEEDINAVFLTRRNMYAQVYFHKTVARIDKMMICALMQLPIDHSNMDNYVDVDDSFVWYHIRHVMKHDVIRCLDGRELDHKCDMCPDVHLKRVAKLSSDTDDNPLLFVRFYK